MNFSIFQAINFWAGQSYWLDKLMVFSADWLGYLLIAGVISCYLRDRQKYRDMLLISLGSAIVSRFGFVTIIRFFYHLPRPYSVLENVNLLIAKETQYSFPSGHASFYFALATGVYLYNKKAGYVYLVLAGLMGFARIFVGVHWSLDILAGAGLGILTAFVAKRVYNKIVPETRVSPA